jgi:protein MpaA
VRRGSIPLALAVLAAAFAPQPAAPAPAERIGRSVEGRAIAVERVGDPSAARTVLVVGSVHGNEPAGRAVVRRLRGARVPPGAQLLLVEDVNPDGSARGTRQNARGVDLNRNASVRWRRLGPPGSTFYPGPRPFSEPETRAIRRLILRERPQVTVWYHQALDLVDPPESGDAAAARLYARRTGMRLRRLPRPPGGLSRWQNARVRRGSSFVVELPAGRLSGHAVARHARAVLALAR